LFVDDVKVYCEISDAGDSVSKKHWISLQIGLKNGSYPYQLASVTYSLLVTLALMTPQSTILTIVSYLEFYPVVTLVLQLLMTCHPLSM